MRAKRIGIGDNYYNGSQYCWPPADCSNRIDGTSSSCWPNCNTDLVVQGNVGIGTTASPGGKLDVNGTIYQRGSVLQADYVFEPEYKLVTIEITVKRKNTPPDNNKAAS